MARKNSISKFIPPAQSIPAMLILGGIGAAIMWKALPRLMQGITEVTPTMPKQGGAK